MPLCGRPVHSSADRERRQAQPLAVRVGRVRRVPRALAGHPAHVRGAHVHAAHGVPPLQEAAARPVQAGPAVPRLPLQCAQEVSALCSQRLQWGDTGSAR